jgi:hypothetical protein
MVRGRAAQHIPSNGRILLLAGLWSLAIVFPVSLLAETRVWRTESVDEAGKFTSIAADNDGNIHLSYTDDQDIKYAFRPAGNKSKWFVMLIDPGNSYTNLALDSQGHPHICYTGRVLRYAHWDGSTWKKQTIATDNAPIGYSCALAISPDGTPHVSWYREKNADNTLYTHIKFAELQNNTWIVRTLDFNMQTGKWESMTLDPRGNPVLSFDAYVKGLLRYAHKDGDEWKIETVDFRGRTNEVYDVGMGNSVVVSKNGTPYISYVDGENVKLAYPSGDNWKVETIDSYHPLGSWVGYRTSLVLDSHEHPHIAYDAGGVLKHAYWDGQKWHIEVLARGGFQGYKYCSLTVDGRDSLYISYTDPDDGSLKVAIGELKEEEGVPLKSAAKPSAIHE